MAVTHPFCPCNRLGIGQFDRTALKSLAPEPVVEMLSCPSHPSVDSHGRWMAPILCICLLPHSHRDVKALLREPPKTVSEYSTVKIRRVISSTGVSRKRQDAGRTRAGVAPVRPVHPPDSNFGGACRSARCRGDRLGSDCRTVQFAGAGGSATSDRVEPCRGRGDARRSFGRSCPYRRYSGARRSGRLPPGALGARGPVSAFAKHVRSPRLLHTSPRSHATGTGAAVDRAAAGRAATLGSVVDLALRRTTIGRRNQPRNQPER